MDLDRIKSLIDAMASSDLAEMQFSEDGWSLRLVRRPRPGDVPARDVAAVARVRPARTRRDPVLDEALQHLVAPLFGIVHLRPAPDAPEFVSPGQAVTAGTPLCIIEAMKMFHEVRAERDAIISAVLVSSGQEVQAGQELMRFA
ncbi:MAG TPA: acetyl-CoA carboxylase biotin carboxyl carrier protein subunit [Bradyrhizobium sp.]|nr:acetyl-CoA carboxylase biotin carboxyl carrier protein subunit [Bradyrhizobium sp.]